MAQQSLFNVPSVTVTDPMHHFLQEQLNVTSQAATLNSVYCFGLLPGWELGLNVLGTAVDWSKGSPEFVLSSGEPGVPAAPSLLLTTLFARNVLPELRLGVGVEFGASLYAPVGGWAPVGFLFTEARATPWGESGPAFYLGLYAGTPAYLGAPDIGWNWMAGLELPLIEEKLEVVADHMHGQNSIGVSVVGLAWTLSHTFILSGGLQIPNHPGVTAWGGVTEFTFDF